MTYEPRPIDTSRITLTNEVLALTERLAEHAHDLWAAKRLAEGWTLGPEKRGDVRQTPLLVPYADLPDSEKQYDRVLVLETIKAILALGFTIEKGAPWSPDGGPS